MLLAVVGLGLSVTIAYQVNLYYNSSDLSIARHTQNLPRAVGG